MGDDHLGILRGSWSKQRVRRKWVNRIWQLGSGNSQWHRIRVQIRHRLIGSRRRECPTFKMRMSYWAKGNLGINFWVLNQVFYRNLRPQNLTLKDRNLGQIYWWTRSKESIIIKRSSQSMINAFRTPLTCHWMLLMRRIRPRITPTWVLITRIINSRREGVGSHHKARIEQKRKGKLMHSIHWISKWWRTTHVINHKIVLSWRAILNTQTRY